MTSTASPPSSKPVRRVTTEWLYDPDRWGHTEYSANKAKEQQCRRPIQKRGLTLERVLDELARNGPGTAGELTKRLGLPTDSALRNVIQANQSRFARTAPRRWKVCTYSLPEDVLPLHDKQEST